MTKPVSKWICNYIHSVFVSLSSAMICLPLKSIMSTGLHGWTATLRGISVPLSRHTSHTRRWHWLHIRDSLTSSLLLFFSSLLFLLFNSFNRAFGIYCGGPWQMRGPIAGPKDREKSERLICPPADVGFGSLEASPLTCPLIQRGVQQDTDRCKLSPRQAEDALRYRSIRAKRPLTCK